MLRWVGHVARMVAGSGENMGLKALKALGK
jgi:hypothetical protein